MVAEDAVVFIDSQQYLDLYELRNGKVLLGLLEEVRERIFVTAQVVNEVDRRKLQAALRYFDKECPKVRGQCAQAKDISEQLPEHLFDASGEAVARIREKLKEANKRKVDGNKLIEEAAKILEEKVAEALRDINLSEDSVSLALKPLFDRAVPHTTEELRLAQERKAKGYPPGKGDTVGDELNWEQLLSFVKANRKKRVWIISRDSDYIVKYGSTVFLNPALRKELLVLSSPAPKVYAHSDVIEGLRDFKKVTGFPLKNFPSPEKEEALKKEQEALKQEDLEQRLLKEMVIYGGNDPASGMTWLPSLANSRRHWEDSRRRAIELAQMIQQQNDEQEARVLLNAQHEQQRRVQGTSSSAAPPSPTKSKDEHP
jgi:PIN domain